MLTHALESRQAYEQGVVEERVRMAHDMHDNIGVQLLGALHSRDIERKDSLIRETLSDLRDIINNTSRSGLVFQDILADLRVEIAEYLASAGIELDWDWVSVEDQPLILKPLFVHALRSMVREATGNVIKHAGASRLRVLIRQQAGELFLAIEDNGKGFASDKVMSGNGLASMQGRVAKLKGTLDIRSDDGGTCLQALFPLTAARESE